MVEHPKIPYSRVKGDGRRYFEPTPKMKAMGFEARGLGPDSAAARLEAWRLYEDWRKAKVAGTSSTEKTYPLNSIGHAWLRYRRTDAWKAKAAVTRRKDWEWSWQFIEPIFGDVAPGTVQVEDIEELRAIVLAKRGLHTANRLIKTWRALWNVMAAMGYCEKDSDPSRIIRNTAPKGRSETWRPGELARICKRGWNEGFYGMAAAISACFDTSFSPGDICKLTAAERVKDARGDYFDTARGKTGKAVLGTLSRRSARVLDAYLAKLGIELHGDAPVFRNRTGKPYTTDTLGDDFRTIRSLVFPDDRRRVQDIRRTGSVEALAGEADPAAMAAKMGNTIDRNRFLTETYLPKKSAVVRRVDEHRKRGRATLRENEK